MARPKGPSSKKAEAAAAAKAAEAAAAAASTLDSALAGGKRRRLSRRGTEKQVERSLKSVHFCHTGEVTMANKVVAGKTTREHPTALIHGLERCHRNGSATYAALARKFTDNEASVEALKPATEGQPIDEGLVRVLALLETDVASGKALRAIRSYLETCAPLNERSVIGLVKATLAPRVLPRAGSDHITVAVMTYCHRRGPRSVRPARSHTRAAAGTPARAHVRRATVAPRTVVF